MEDGLLQCEHVREKDTERKHWDMWIAKWPHMTKKNFIPFEQFYKKPVKAKISRQSSAEILSKVQKIKMRFDERRA